MVMLKRKDGMLFVTHPDDDERVSLRRLMLPRYTRAERQTAIADYLQRLGHEVTADDEQIHVWA